MKRCVYLKIVSLPARTLFRVASETRRLWTRRKCPLACRLRVTSHDRACSQAIKLWNSFSVTQWWCSCLDLSSFFLFTLQKAPVEFFGVPLNDQTLLDADPNYVLSACRPSLSHDTYEEHFIHLNSGCRTPKQALRSLLQVVAGLDPNSQDECFEAVVSALREASNEGFLHVIERLQKGNMFCKT